jgi:hypothetical protein
MPPVIISEFAVEHRLKIGRNLSPGFCPSRIFHLALRV